MRPIQKRRVSETTAGLMGEGRGVHNRSMRPVMLEPNRCQPACAIRSFDGVCHARRLVKTVGHLENFQPSFYTKVMLSIFSKNSTTPYLFNTIFIYLQVFEIKLKILIG
jgi:hypothetical protein